MKSINQGSHISAVIAVAKGVLPSSATRDVEDIHSPSCARNVVNHSAMLPKVEIPLSKEVNPRAWVRCCHKYFLVHGTPEGQKVEVASFFKFP